MSSGAIGPQLSWKPIHRVYEFHLRGPTRSYKAKPVDSRPFPEYDQVLDFYKDKGDRCTCGKCTIAPVDYLDQFVKEVKEGIVHIPREHEFCTDAVDWQILEQNCKLLRWHERRMGLLVRDMHRTTNMLTVRLPQELVSAIARYVVLMAKEPVLFRFQGAKFGVYR